MATINRYNLQSTVDDPSLRSGNYGMPFGLNSYSTPGGRAFGQMDPAAIMAPSRPATINRPSGTGAVTPAYPGASYGTGADGFDAPVSYAAKPAYPGATYGTGANGFDAPVTPTINRPSGTGVPATAHGYGTPGWNPAGGDSTGATGGHGDPSGQGLGYGTTRIGYENNAYGDNTPMVEYWIGDGSNPGRWVSSRQATPQEVSAGRATLSPSDPGYAATVAGSQGYANDQRIAAYENGGSTLAPSATINRPGQNMGQVGVAGDYIPPTQSAFATAPGFDQQAYADAYINQGQNAIRQDAATGRAQLVADMARRGLSPEAQQAQLAQYDAGLYGQLGQNRADATAKAADLAHQDAITRAGQIDNYGLARGGFGISYAADSRNAAAQSALLPGQVIGQGLNNATAAQYLNEQQTTAPARADLIRAQADGAIQAAKQAGIDTSILGQTADTVVQQAQVSAAAAQTALQMAQQQAKLTGDTLPDLIDAKKSELEAAIAQGKQDQWEAQNANWLAILKFFGNLASGAAQAAVGTIARKV